MEVLPTAASSPIGTISTAIGAGLQIGIDTVAGLPAGLSFAAAAIVNNPASAPDVLNFLITSFIDPNANPYAPIGAPQSLVFQLSTRVLLPLAQLLPEPLQHVVFSAYGVIADGLGAVIDHLPGDYLDGLIAVGTGKAILAMQHPEYYAAVTHIQDTGEALGEKVFDFFSHSGGSQVETLRVNDTQEAVVHETDGNGQKGLPGLGNLFHPRLSPGFDQVDVDEVEADVTDTKPSKPRLGVLTFNPLNAIAKGPATSVNGSLLGSNDEKQKEGVQDGSTGITPVKHGLGIGKTPVHDLIKKITSGKDCDNESDGGTGEAAAK